MDWQRLDNKKDSKIIYYIGGLDFDNHENYDELINEVIDSWIAKLKSTSKARDNVSSNKSCKSKEKPHLIYAEQAFSVTL